MNLMDAILKGNKDLPFVKQGSRSCFEEFHSPIDGERIASKAQLKNHEKKHDVVQTGNELKSKGCNGLTREQSKLKQQGKI